MTRSYLRVMALGVIAAGVTVEVDRTYAQRIEQTTPAGSARLDELLANARPKIENGRRVWEYELVVSERHHRLVDGTMYKVWAFGGQTPGPTLIAREGDWVRIKLINETSASHTIHSHGLWVPHRMDGAPHPHEPDKAHGGHAHQPGQSHDMPSRPVWADPIGPGQTYTYEYIARPSGTHFYHCHVNTNEHLDRGMSGALIVLPRIKEPKVDQDMVLLLDEWDRSFAEEGTPGHPRDTYHYDIFTMNGRSYPDTESFQLKLGDVVRIRFINAGAQSHSMHLHGHEFLVTHKDGQALAEPALMDTVAVAPGERVDIVFVANNPGEWPMHCHSSPHVTNAGKYPGGMMAHFLVGKESLPRTGQGPVRPGIREMRDVWRASAKRALRAGKREKSKKRK